jgi:uncharacterized protein (TIGR00297 family)
MVTFLTLDEKAAVLALVIGALILYFGGAYGLFFLAVIFFFLALSAFVTNIGIGMKKRIKVYESKRGWKNVVANGIVPLIIVMIYWYVGSSSPYSVALITVYIASVAGTTADKFASELGVLGRENPVSIMTLKPVKKGVSGGITLFGTASSFVGAMLIGLSVLAIGLPMNYIVIIAVAGLIGSLVDSVAGHFEEHGFGSKYSSNVLCAIAAAVIVYVIIVL